MRLTSARIGPSMPCTAQASGGLTCVTSDTDVRTVPPTRRVITHLDPTWMRPSPSMCPLTTPDCHSLNCEGSVA